MNSRQRVQSQHHSTSPADLSGQRPGGLRRHDLPSQYGHEHASSSSGAGTSTELEVPIFLALEEIPVLDPSQRVYTPFPGEESGGDTDFEVEGDETDSDAGSVCSQNHSQRQDWRPSGNRARGLIGSTATAGHSDSSREATTARYDSLAPILRARAGSDSSGSACSEEDSQCPRERAIVQWRRQQQQQQQPAQRQLPETCPSCAEPMHVTYLDEAGDSVHVHEQPDGGASSCDGRRVEWIMSTNRVRLVARVSM